MHLKQIKHKVALKGLAGDLLGQTDFLGIRNVNFVPLPFALSKVTFPPSNSVSRLTTASPKPCPLAFVVNSGLKILSLTSSGMPLPVSSIVMIAFCASHVAFMSSCPPFGIAWTAFEIKFVSIRFM
jgi:hypothetical protein